MQRPRRQRRDRLDRGSKLGRILVDGRGRTLYLFETDSRGHSCLRRGLRGLLAAAARQGQADRRARAAKQALLGTTRRADGTTAGDLRRATRSTGSSQDSRPGQTTGQDLHDFGAGWYVVAPAGTKIESDGS